MTHPPSSQSTSPDEFPDIKDDATATVTVFDNGNVSLLAILQTHMDQLARFHKTATELCADLKFLGIEEGDASRLPPEDIPKNGFLCMGCGADRGFGMECRRCGRPTSCGRVDDGVITETALPHPKD